MAEGGGGEGNSALMPLLLPLVLQGLKGGDTATESEEDEEAVEGPRFVTATERAGPQ